MDVDLSSVHVRETGMTAPELLMSESQERMMAFVEPSKVDDVLAVAARWEIDASVVGTVKPGGMLRVFQDGTLVAELPAASLSEDAPIYHRPLGEPHWMEDIWAKTLTFMTRPGIAESLVKLLDDPSLASKAWVYEQYDHMLFLNTVVPPGNDSSLLRIQGTDKALAVSTDGNGELCYLDPRRGSARLVYEAALNVALAGATPLAVVDNLNFGNPEKPEVMWQFRESIEGISEACEALGLPVVGGNVSFYNETDGDDIYPTPVIGLVGMVEPMPENPPRLNRVEAGMQLWLIGTEWAVNLAGSAFERVTFAHVGGRPSSPDRTMASAAIEMATRLANEVGVPALHDISDGGLALSVAEMAIAGRTGVKVAFSDWRNLFSEDPHRFLAAVPGDKAGALADLASGIGIPAIRIGEFGGDEIAFEQSGIRASVALATATELYTQAIPRRMQ
jgi:phosphoribosylformylglycinamidine synthase